MDAASAFAPSLFSGKCIWVSGGTSGIGLAIATGFARLGGEVIASGSSAKKIEALKANPPAPGMRFQSFDVRDAQAATQAFAELSRLDVLVNAAGTGRGPQEFTVEGFLEVMDINLHSIMRNCLAARALLAKSQGVIINIASMLSYVADAAVPAYGASKTGILGLTRSLAHAFGPEGVRVNAIAPGYHKTDMTVRLQGSSTLSERIVARTALKRWGTAEDVVGAALFLASPAAAYITGTDLVVDGGFVTGSV